MNNISKMHKAKKIATGVYEYRGVVISKDNSGFWESEKYGIATSLAEAKKDVDFYADVNSYVGVGYNNGWATEAYNTRYDY